MENETLENMKEALDTTRTAEILYRGEWRGIPFANLKLGQLFKLKDYTGEYVDGGEICVADSDAFISPKGVLTVHCSRPWEQSVGNGTTYAKDFPVKELFELMDKPVDLTNGQVTLTLTITGPDGKEFKQDICKAPVDGNWQFGFKSTGTADLRRVFRDPESDRATFNHFGGQSTISWFTRPQGQTFPVIPELEEKKADGEDATRSS